MKKTLLEVAGVLSLVGKEYSLSPSRNYLKNSYPLACDCGDCSSDNCDCTSGGDCVGVDCNEGSDFE
jgi:hypothetical protein